MWILTLVMGFAHAADCVESASTVTLGAALDRAEAAFGALDKEAFATEMEAARAQLPCLDEAMPTALAASLHRYEGLSAFLTGAPERAQRAFAGARLLEPAYRFPRSLVPEGNPVLAAYEALDVAEDQVVAAPAPADGALRINGRVSLERSTSFPVVFQRIDGDGAVAESAYLWPSMPLPSYEVAPERSASSSGGVDVAAVGLLAGAGAAAITSGVLYGLARSHANRFDDPSTPYVDLASEQQAANQLGTASGVALGVAAGAGLGGVLVGVF